MINYDDNFPYTSGLSFANELASRFKAIKDTLNNGALSAPGVLKYRDAWDAATAYVAFDVVSSGGSKWIARANSTNSAPVEGADWTALGGTSTDGGGAAPSGAANLFYATPTGAAGAAALRAIGAADLPSGTTTTKGAVQVAAAGAATAGRVAAADDPRLSDARTPTAHVHPAAQISDLTEAVQDAVGAFLQAGAGISIAYNDALNTFTITNSAPLSAESVQDIVGAMTLAGSNATAVYDDAAGTLTISASGGSGGTATSAEEIQDIVASLIAAGTNVGISYSDAANTLTITASGGVAGNNGWTPTLAIVVDGERSVLRVTGWTGGSGAVPASGAYLGAAGYVAAIADAANVRGAQGAPDTQSLARLDDLEDELDTKTATIFVETEADIPVVLAAGTTVVVRNSSEPIAPSGPGGGLTETEADGLYRRLDVALAFTDLSAKPSTLAGYGITDAFSAAQFADFIGAAPAALDTVYEIVAQLQNDETALGTLSNSITAIAGARYTKTESDALYRRLDVPLVATDISDSSATGRALIKATDAAAARTALELKSAALLDAGANNGAATLGADGILTASQRPPATGGGSGGNSAMELLASIVVSAGQTPTFIRVQDIPATAKDLQFILVAAKSGFGAGYFYLSVNGFATITANTADGQSRLWLRGYVTDYANNSAYKSMRTEYINSEGTESFANKVVTTNSATTFIQIEFYPDSGAYFEPGSELRVYGIT